MHINIMYPWGCTMKVADGASDSDWAGCRTTRTSTSGGCIRLGGCIIKAWSRQQRAIALSSGEAELYAAVKTVQELLGIKSLGTDLGMNIRCNLQIDAKATVGMLSRKGAGRNRHIGVQHFCVRDVIRSGAVSLERVWSSKNVADILTKYVEPRVLDRHLEALRISRNSLMRLTT